eukprot:1618499-Rhodomonas_salina.1
MAFTTATLSVDFQKVFRGTRNDFVLLLLLLATWYCDTVDAFLFSSICVSQSDRKLFPTRGFIPEANGFVVRKHKIFSRHGSAELEKQTKIAAVRRGGAHLDLRASTEGYASEDKAQRFCEWLRERGAKGIGSNVIVRCTDAGQYGLFAARDIAHGEKVLSVPMQTLSFSEERVLSHADEAALDLCRDALRDMYAFSSDSPHGDPLIVIQLLLELARGRDSPWAPYLDVLPPLERADAAWLWSEERGLLDGPVRYFAERVGKSVYSEFNELDRS